VAKVETDDVVRWLTVTPLYVGLDEQPSPKDAIMAILRFGSTFDMYCPGCAESATFRGFVTDQTESDFRRFNLNGSTEQFVKARFSKRAYCTRRNHPIDYYFANENEVIQKVGQYPSIADIAIAETARYKKVLDAEYLREINKAIGLAAHGVGIGAYIYLRRIFEGLVEEARDVAAKRQGWDDAAFRQARMADRVVMLKDDLPDFLVQNPALYGILSKHVHELSEADCLKNFDALKTAVLLIAEDRLEKAEKKATRAKTAATLRKLQTAVGEAKRAN
jgi:hypothetical protein